MLRRIFHGFGGDRGVFHQALHALSDPSRDAIRHMLGSGQSSRGHEAHGVLQIAWAHGFDGSATAQLVVAVQQRVVDVLGIDPARHLFQHRLHQPALERVELPVWHPLSAVAHVDRQQIAGLDLVGDPTPKLACQLRVVRDRKVVRRLEGLQHLHALLLHLGAGLAASAATTLGQP